MNIDYSVPKSKQNIHFVYSNFQFGVKHIQLACSKQIPLSLIERIKHFTIGLIECVPLIGHIISLVDRSVSHINSRILNLNQKSPFECGYIHGIKYKREIQILYKLVKKKINQLENEQPLSHYRLLRIELLYEINKFKHAIDKKLEHHIFFSVLSALEIPNFINIKTSSQKIEKLKYRLIKILNNHLPKEKLNIHSRENGFKIEISRNIRHQPNHKLWIKKLVNHLNTSQKEEMKGLAKGAQVSYEDVLNVNTFLDRFPGTFGCSALATIFDRNTSKRLATTNHFISQPEECERLDKLNKIQINRSLKSHKQSLKQVSVKETRQSIVFDTRKQKFYISTSNNNATTKTYVKFNKIFHTQKIDSFENQIRLSRNLDWPWPIAPQTLILIKNGVSSITFPGFIGTLSAINQHGVSLAACSSGESIYIDGDPVPLLLQKIMKKAKTVFNFIHLLKHYRPASSLNLTLAGKDGIARVELDPARKRFGAAHYHLISI